MIHAITALGRMPVFDSCETLLHQSTQKEMNIAIAISQPKGVISFEGSMVFKIQK